MTWHKILMKFGMGSPGYIAKNMAKNYRKRKALGPAAPESSIIHRVFVDRVAAQSFVGGPIQYKFLKNNPNSIQELLDHNPDLFSIVTLAVFIEHPELVSAAVPTEAFQVLKETLEEVLDSEAPGWRTAGIWSEPTVICSQCEKTIELPNPAVMSAYRSDTGEIEYQCDRCAPPLQVRAISALGFFMRR